MRPPYLRLTDTTSCICRRLASFAIALRSSSSGRRTPGAGKAFDHYHDLGRLLARGEPFPTTDVPWGYRVFSRGVLSGRSAIGRGFRCSRRRRSTRSCRSWCTVSIAIEFDRRTAIAASVLTGVRSFNTVYASTQSSDAVCTVLFVGRAAGVRARARRQRLAWLAFAAAGLLLGLAPQFRPNLLLLPPVLASVARPRSAPHRLRRARRALRALLRGIGRRPRSLDGSQLPAARPVRCRRARHGGVQLWYGTLQTGPYLTSRAYNPRSVFEFAASVPLHEPRPRAAARHGSNWRRALHLVRESSQPRLLDRPQPDPRPRAPHGPTNTAEITAEMAPWHRAPTVYYYYFDVALARPIGFAQPHDHASRGRSPRLLVYFVSEDHLTDPDDHGDLLDVFDLVSDAPPCRLACTARFCRSPRLRSRRTRVRDRHPTRSLADAAFERSVESNDNRSG